MVPKIERRILALSVLFVAVQGLLIAFAAYRYDVTVPSCDTRVKPFDQAELIQIAPDRYEVHVVARMWEFSPATIRVPKGSTVDFYVTSLDVTHGFFVDHTNVNLTALPGLVNYARAHFHSPGHYAILCHEFCGTGHDAMSASIEVSDSNTPGSATL